MTRNCGIRCTARRLTLAVLAVGVLAGVWSASAFAQSALGASAGSLVGNATQAVGQSTAPVVATAQSAVPSVTAAASSAPATTATTDVVARASSTAETATAAATTSVVGSTLTTATTEVVKPVVGTVAQTVEAASESVSSTSQGTLDPVASLAGGALPPTVPTLVTTAGRTAAPVSHQVVGGSSTVATQPDQQPMAAIGVIAPALDSPVAPAAPGRAVSAPRGGTHADPGSQTTLRRAQRHLTPSGGTSAAIFGGPGELILPPARHTASAKRGGSLPRIPDIPGGLLAGSPAAGASGGSTGLVAALIAALLLAVPRVGRWLRPSVATRRLPIPQLSLERPG